MDASPLRIWSAVVLPGWLDPIGHMNVAYYALTFDDACSALYDGLGIGFADIARTRRSVFTMENHICYLREVHGGDRLSFDIRVLDCDEKRIHFFTDMIQVGEGYLAATCETLGLHVDMETRRSSSFEPELRAAIEALRDAHRPLARPVQAGRSIGIQRRKREGAA